MTWLLDAPTVTLEESQTMKGGDPVSIDCSAFVTDANPAATSFQWIRNSEVVSMDSVLTFDSVTRDDAGAYTCWAFNEFYDGNQGKGESTINLLVQCKFYIIY